MKEAGKEELSTPVITGNALRLLCEHLNRAEMIPPITKLTVKEKH
jgi:hypothetical protein